MNTKLLKKLYLQNSYSGSEDKMKSLLCYLEPGFKEHNKNLYLTKGKAPYPCFVAHLDEVHRTSPNKIIQVDNILFGYDTKLKSQAGIGADDKNGIFICLELIKRLDNVKIALFVEEETGRYGSRNADKKFFEDCQFIVQMDRKNGSDFVTQILGTKICSDEFISDTALLRKKYKYIQEQNGGITDVDELVHITHLSCTNLSCGYYRPHTEMECTVIDELQNCLEFCTELGMLTKKYPYIPVTKTYNYNYDYENYADFYSKRAIKRNWNYLDNYEACHYCNTYDCKNCNYLKRKEISEKKMMEDKLSLQEDNLWIACSSCDLNTCGDCNDDRKRSVLKRVKSGAVQKWKYNF